MKKQALLLLIAICAIACQEEITYQEGQFQRIIGFEGSSSVEKIKELENGDIMLLGKMGVSAHELTSTDLGVEIEAVEDQAPFIGITDANGYLKMLRSYPIEKFDTHPAIEVLNPENKLTFIDILENPNGGYHVLAELRGFDIRVQLAGLDTTIISVPGYLNRAPLLVEMDEQFNVKRSILFTGHKDWDFTIRSLPIMKPVSPNEFVILFNHKITFPAGDFIGYSLLHLNHQLDTLGFHENFDSNQTKTGYDFDVDDGVINVFGTDNGQFHIYQHLIADGFKQQAEVMIDNSSSERNNNIHFLKKLANGNLMVLYTARFNIIRAKVFSPELQLIEVFDLENGTPETTDIRVPRDLYEMQNGDLLVYSLFIPASKNADPVRGEIIRFSSSGLSKFRISVAGSPGGILELKDGNILYATNMVHNELVKKIHLIKVNENGQLY